jgi:HB1, ASXL, restriction endonuclease HTH domain
VTVEPIDAALTVLKEAGEPLHWTVIQDRALRAGYLDPFELKDVRKHLLAALSDAARAGTLIKDAKGVYRVPS